MGSFTATITTSSYFDNERTQVWTNLGPLTTSFTPPPSCKTDPAKEGLVEFHISSGSTTILSYDCGQANNHFIQSPKCYPSSSGVSVLQTASKFFAGYWSPGLICPSGWSTGYSWTYPASYSASLGVVDNLLIGNPDMPATFAKCCPSGYTFDSSGYCAYGVTTPTFGAMCSLDYHCTTNNTSASYICPTSPVAYTWSPAQSDTQISITAWGMLLIHQPSDMSLVQSSTSTTTSGTHTSTTRTGGVTTATGNHHDHGTSTKVLVTAIVVPVVALFAIIAAIIFLLRARKRRARARAYAGSARIAPFGHEKSTATSSVMSSDRSELQHYRGD